MTARNKAVQWLLGALLVAAGQVYAQDQARQWLDDMSSALRNLNYDGIFVYLHDGRLEAMRIIHRVDGEDERERLVSLNGSAREVLRDNETVTCIMPDSKSVMIGQSRPQQPFPVVPRDLDSLQKYYRIESVGDDRMAGYMTHVVAITPRDMYRYGYRFWIDKDSKMLLKSDLTGADNKAIEQVMFTWLGIGSKISDAALEPSLTGDGYAWYRQGSGDTAVATASGSPRWEARWLPAGFRLTNYQRMRLQSDSEGTEHMVYSDGLATVSVYAEMTSADGNAFTGLSSRGAMNAFGAVVEGHQITVVGEVPPVTVEMMARSVDARQGVLK